MNKPKELTTVEFGWNGTDGYTRNSAKYSLLYTKVDLSFSYDSIFMSSGEPDSYKVLNGELSALTQSELVEVVAKAIELSVTDTWSGLKVETLPVYSIWAYESAPEEPPTANKIDFWDAAYQDTSGGATMETHRGILGLS